MTARVMEPFVSDLAELLDTRIDEIQGVYALDSDDPRASQVGLTALQFPEGKLGSLFETLAGSPDGEDGIGLLTGGARIEREATIRGKAVLVLRNRSRPPAEEISDFIYVKDDVVFFVQLTDYSGSPPSEGFLSKVVDALP